MGNTDKNHKQVQPEKKMKQAAEGFGQLPRSVRRSHNAFCPVCAKHVELISFENAAGLFHTDLQDIRFLTESGDVHQLHNRKGQVMACRPSLCECFENRRTRLLDSGFLMEIAAKKSA